MRVKRTALMPDEYQVCPWDVDYYDDGPVPERVEVELNESEYRTALHWLGTRTVGDWDCNEIKRSGLGNGTYTYNVGREAVKRGDIGMLQDMLDQAEAARFDQSPVDQVSKTFTTKREGKQRWHVTMSAEERYELMRDGVLPRKPNETWVPKTRIESTDMWHYTVQGVHGAKAMDTARGYIKQREAELVPTWLLQPGEVLNVSLPNGERRGIFNVHTVPTTYVYVAATNSIIVKPDEPSIDGVKMSVGDKVKFNLSPGRLYHAPKDNGPLGEEWADLGYTDGYAIDITPVPMKWLDATQLQAKINAMNGPPAMKANKISLEDWFSGLNRGRVNGKTTEHLDHIHINIPRKESSDMEDNTAEGREAKYQRRLIELLARGRADAFESGTVFDGLSDEQVNSLAEQIVAEENAEAQAIAAKAALDARADEFRKALSNEPQADDAAITWTHQYDTDGKVYQYLGLRIVKDNGQAVWYTTTRGEAKSGQTWAELVRKFKALRTGDYWVVSEYVRPVE